MFTQAMFSRGRAPAHHGREVSTGRSVAASAAVVIVVWIIYYYYHHYFFANFEHHYYYYYYYYYIIGFRSGTRYARSEPLA